MELLRPIDVKPVHPKNGDKWRTKEGIFEFRYGRFMPLAPKGDVLGLETKQFS